MGTVAYGTLTVVLVQTGPAEEVPFTMKTTEPAGTDAPGKVSLTAFIMPAFNIATESGILEVVLMPFRVDELSVMPVTVVESVLRTLN